MVAIKHKNPTNEIICPCCNTELIYAEDDVVSLYSGKGIVCPVCGEDVVTYEAKPFEFPDGFHHFGEHKGSCFLSNNEIQDYINDTVKDLRESVLEFDLSYRQCGNTIVFGIKSDEGITVWVAKNYYEAYEFFD